MLVKDIGNVGFSLDLISTVYNKVDNLLELWFFSNKVLYRYIRVVTMLNFVVRVFVLVRLVEVFVLRWEIWLCVSWKILKFRFCGVVLSIWLVVGLVVLGLCSLGCGNVICGGDCVVRSLWLLYGVVIKGLLVVEVVRFFKKILKFVLLKVVWMFWKLIVKLLYLNDVICKNIVCLV